MAHVVTINQVNFTQLPRTYEQMRMRDTAHRVWQHDRAACPQIVVQSVHRALIEGCEIICQRKVCSLSQLDEAVAKILRIGTCIECAVAGHGEDGTIGRSGKTRPAHPDSAVIGVWRAIVDPKLL